MVKTSIKRLRGHQWLRFRVGLVNEDGSFRGSNFSRRGIEDTSGFSYSFGQLLDIRKTFRLFADG
uniref:Uncharacterized protein n=1 Tax=Romanomermis culicivorax TaxID=13658 RepID=A0A915I2N0_ROMCU